MAALLFLILKTTDFNFATNENDISLVKLDVPVIFSDYIIPACLPTHDHDVTVGLNCVITGWGDTQGKPFRFKIHLK